MLARVGQRGMLAPVLHRVPNFLVCYTNPLSFREEVNSYPELNFQEVAYVRIGYRVSLQVWKCCLVPCVVVYDVMFFLSYNLDWQHAVLKQMFEECIYFAAPKGIAAQLIC